MHALNSTAPSVQQAPPPTDLAAARAQIVSGGKEPGTVPEKAKGRRVAPRRKRRRSDRHALRHVTKIIALGVPVEATIRSGDLRVDLRAGPTYRDEVHNG